MFKRSGYKKLVAAAQLSLWSAGAEVAEAFAGVVRAARSEERLYRTAGFNDHHPYAWSIADCARLMAVRWVAQALLDGTQTYTVSEVLDMRPDVARAKAFAERYGAEVRAAWVSAGIELASLASLDYAKAVSPERFAQDGGKN